MKMVMFLLLLFLLNSGCISAIGMRPNNMTPEEIKAFNDAGSSVYSCFSIGGPPPVGGLAIITMPKSQKPNVSYSANCQLLKAEVK